MRETLEPNAAALTLDAGPSSVSLDPDAPRIGFVEGSRPQLANETTTVLRTRLRAAAGLLGLAFGVFFILRLIIDTDFGAYNDLTFYGHFGITVILIASFFLLCRKCMIPLSVLRGYELVIFGLPVIYFFLNQYGAMKLLARSGNLQNPLASWMGTVFLYAMFIPNTWRRAAVFIGTMCAAPVVLVLLLWYQDPTFAGVLDAHRGFLSELVIMMSVTALAATYGTHLINALRYEAFEAKQLGNYRLCGLIGSGGMGEVYLAEHQMMKRPVAIKLIRPGKAADPQALARFEREVRATAKLSHWNTIEIFDYGRAEDGTFYYVMEYLPGLSLAELVEKHGPLPPPRAIHLLVQACDALAEAHAAGLIHRDIKPGNIFAAQRGGVYDVAKLLDFGLAKPVSSETQSVQLTQEGSITGSPLYMSPEQALGDSEPDARSDIYSLGAVAYFLLTGAPPFDGDKPIKVILAHAHQPVVAPSRLRSEVGPDLDKVVLRCLAKDPADRYRSVLELRQALSDCVAAGGWNHQDALRWWTANGVAHKQAEALAASAI